MCNKTKFNDYKDCLLNNAIILKLQQRFKNEAHNLYTEEIINIALIRNDDKRLQIFDRITSYPYDTNAGKVCKTELLKYLNINISLICQPDIDKIYLYAKDPYEAKYQSLINKREKIGLKHYDNPIGFTEYSNYM